MRFFFFHADNEDSDQAAQVDLSLLWPHMSEGTFSDVKGSYHENDFG